MGSMFAGLFFRPWANTQFVSPHKDGGASVAIISQSFEIQLGSFYAAYNPQVLQDQPEKVTKIVAKRDAISKASGRSSFEAKTLAALHTKYDTNMMGAQISPIEGGVDCAGALSSSFHFIVPRGLLDKWKHFMVDVVPDLYYFVSPAQY